MHNGLIITKMLISTVFQVESLFGEYVVPGKITFLYSAQWVVLIEEVRSEICIPIQSSYSF